MLVSGFDLAQLAENAAQRGRQLLSNLQTYLERDYEQRGLPNFGIEKAAEIIGCTSQHLRDREGDGMLPQPRTARVGSLDRRVYNYNEINNLNNNLFSENTAVDANDDCDNYQTGTVTGANNLSNQSINDCANAGIASGINPDNIGLLDDYGCINPTAQGDCVHSYILIFDSIAKDAGDENSTTFDQRGFAANGIRDIGAFESQGIIDLIYKSSFE